MIPRLVQNEVISDLKQDTKTVIILGARQVGKTTLVKEIERKFTEKQKKALYLNCDIEEQKKVVNTTSIALLTQLLQNIEVLFIDEAQRLDNPGLTIKIIHDNFPNIKILVTGSSSFELQNKLSDPLTGRIFNFTLYPLSFREILNYQYEDENIALLKQQADALIPSVLTYGLYPAVYQENDPLKKQRLLAQITESYLFKDILSFQKVRNSQAIQNLARALAYQIGSEVSETELASRLGIDRKTVSSYIDILEQAFVVIRLTPHSKNPRREIGGKYKVFFLDLGIRNALIGDFNDPAIRSDRGFLWENFLILERMKAYANENKQLLHYNFWRNYDGAEVDYLEKPLSGALQAYEFKYKDGNVSRGANTFITEYKTSVTVINQENYLDFISTV
ncbi:MAG TPA: ATP-binding protein [Candidatus Saccharimonadales bacterium]|nr:ATP-binding protein [Candidatus Saccharimonadales bacterium]